jgi:hypothetical protein
MRKRQPSARRPLGTPNVSVNAAETHIDLDIVVSAAGTHGKRPVNFFIILEDCQPAARPGPQNRGAVRSRNWQPGDQGMACAPTPKGAKHRTSFAPKLLRPAIGECGKETMMGVAE